MPWWRKKLRLSLFTVQAGPGEPIVFTNPKLIAPPHRWLIAPTQVCRDVQGASLATNSCTCRSCQLCWVQDLQVILSFDDKCTLHSVTAFYEILRRVTVQLQHLQCHQALVHYKQVCLNELKRKRTSSGIYSQNEVCTSEFLFASHNQKKSLMKINIFS